MTKIDSKTVETISEILKSPADVVTIVKGSDGQMSASTITGILGLATSFAGMVATNEKVKAVLSRTGLGISAGSLILDTEKVFEEWNKGKVSDKTITSLVSNILAVTAGVAGIVGTGGLLVPMGMIAATGLALWSAFESNDDTDISDAKTELLNNISSQLQEFSTSFTDSIDNVLYDLEQGIFDPDFDPYELGSREERTKQDTWTYNINSTGKIDPLVLDLNQDGIINTTKLEESNVYFDLDDNGISENTAWIGKEDGVLVYDRNSDRKIDNINELFGNALKDGFTELKKVV